MTKTILFLSKGTSASSTRYRALQYFPLFKKSEFEPKHFTISGGVVPFIKALYKATQADTVVLIRKTFPHPLFWLLRKFSKKIIFDFDDAIFCNTDGTESKTRMNRFGQTIKQCDMVFAGNHYLAEMAQRYQQNTIVIPTSLDTKKYNLSIKKESQYFSMVWIGSRSTKKYIAGILPALEHASQLIPNLRLKIIADFNLTSSQLIIDNIPWSEDSEAQAVYEADIGLAPLPANNWTKGKCALKVLQYMAAGLPVITSPTGANAEVIKHGLNGFYANNLDEWSSMVYKAYEEKIMLSSMGSAGRERVSCEFDSTVIFNNILSHIQEI